MKRSSWCQEVCFVPEIGVFGRRKYLFIYVVYEAYFTVPTSSKSDLTKKSNECMQESDTVPLNSGLMWF